MAMQLYHVVSQLHIPVDQWGTEMYPISDSDRIFRNVRGEIILPLHELFGNPENDSSEAKQLDYFAMQNKRAYNSDDVRNHICQYLNYFEKFYDYNHELLMILYRIKILIDYEPSYSIDNFVEDVGKYIIFNFELTRKVRHFVDDNYNMKLSSNNNKTPNLQFNDKHAKVLYEISLLMNMYIPLAAHYMYVHFIKQSPDIQSLMLRLFDLCTTKYEQERGIYIYEKLYEMATSVVNKSVGVDKVLWQKNLIRSNNPTTHIRDTILELILQIIVKYNYVKHIINFNYTIARDHLRYKIIEIPYEFHFCKLSASKRDSDNNSELDRYESRIAKRDEAVALQNKVSAEQTVRNIVMRYGPISDEEVAYYRKRLTANGTPLINNFQMQLVGYMFYKDFGDSSSFMSIRNGTDYIKLIICAKRLLKGIGMIILPYIFSSKITRNAARKSISRKDTSRYEHMPIYEDLRRKYNNDGRILQKIWELIGSVASSTFEIIEWDDVKHASGEYDGLIVPMINDIIYEEMLMFISSI